MPYRNERSLLSNQPAKKQSLMSLAATAKRSDENKENVQNVTPDAPRKETTPSKKSSSSSKGEKNVQIIESTAIVNTIPEENKKDADRNPKKESGKASEKTEKETSPAKANDSKNSKEQPSPKSSGLCRNKSDVEVKDTLVAKSAESQEAKSKEKTTEEAHESKGPKPDKESKQASKSSGLCRSKGDVDVKDTASEQPDKNQQSSADTKSKKVDNSQSTEKTEQLLSGDNSNEPSSTSGGICKSKKDVEVTDSITKSTEEDKEKTTENKTSTTNPESPSTKPIAKSEDNNKNENAKSGGICRSKADVEVEDSLSSPSEQHKPDETAVKAEAEEKGSASKTVQPGKPSGSDTETETAGVRETQEKESGGFCKSKKDVKVEDSLSVQTAQEVNKEIEARTSQSVATDPVSAGKRVDEKARVKEDKSKAMPQASLDETETKTKTSTEKSGTCCGGGSVVVDDSVRQLDKPTEDAGTSSKGDTSASANTPKSSSSNSPQKKDEASKPPPPSAKSGICCGPRSVEVNDSLRPLSAAENVKQDNQNTSAKVVQDDSFGESIYRGLESIDGTDGASGSYENDKESAAGSRDDKDTETAQKKEAKPVPKERIVKLEEEKSQATEGQIKEKKKATKKKVKTEKEKRSGHLRVGENYEEEQEGLIGQDIDVEEDVYDEYPPDIVYVDPEPPPPMLKKARKTKKKKSDEEYVKEPPESSSISPRKGKYSVAQAAEQEPLYSEVERRTDRKTRAPDDPEAGMGARDKETPIKSKRKKKKELETKEDIRSVYENQIASLAATSGSEGGFTIRDQPTVEEESELLENAEEERKKNKQRLREKKSKEAAHESPVKKADASLVAYENAQREIDRVLAPRITADDLEDEDEDEDGKRKKKHKGKGKKKKKSKDKDGEENEAYSSDEKREETLEEARAKMHQLLDDAFSLLSHSRSSMSNKVAPSKQGSEEKSPSKDKKKDSPRSGQGSSHSSPRQEDKKEEKKHTPMHIIRSHEPYDRSGLVTWDPYKASDETAVISLPNTQTNLNSQPPQQEKLTTSTFIESLPGSLRPNFFTTQPAEPIVIKSNELLDQESNAARRERDQDRYTSPRNGAAPPGGTALNGAYTNPVFDRSSIKQPVQENGISPQNHQYVESHAPSANGRHHHHRHAPPYHQQPHHHQQLQHQQQQKDYEPYYGLSSYHEIPQSSTIPGQADDSNPARHNNRGKLNGVGTLNFTNATYNKGDGSAGGTINRGYDNFEMQPRKHGHSSGEEAPPVANHRAPQRGENPNIDVVDAITGSLQPGASPSPLISSLREEVQALATKRGSKNPGSTSSSRHPLGSSTVAETSLGRDTAAEKPSSRSLR